MFFIIIFIHLSSKLALSTQQASFIIIRHGTCLLCTLLPFYTCIITLGKYE